MAKILIVDDDIPLSETIAAQLATDHYETIMVHTAEDGLKMATSHHFDLILLDVMIPMMGGVQLCKQLRPAIKIPILFLTALGDVENVVAGLNAGADDYLVKPYEAKVLFARIQAHLRRASRLMSNPQNLLSFSNGQFVIDFHSRRVHVQGKDVDLTPREFELLAVLTQNAGRVVTTEELIELAWGAKFRDATENLKPYIHYLRRKLEADPADPRWIMTARGVGYRFNDEPTF